MSTKTEPLTSLTDIIFPTKTSQRYLGEVKATEHVANQFFASIGVISLYISERGGSVFIIASKTEIAPGFFNIFARHFPGMFNETNKEAIEAALLAYLLDCAEKKIQSRSYSFDLDERGVLIKRNKKPA